MTEQELFLKKGDMDRKISEFKEKFEKEFGISPIVMYQIEVHKIPIPKLVEIMNKMLDESSSGMFKMINDTSRKQVVVAHRQTFYKIARDMGYTYSYISKSIGFDHATVIYAINKVKDMIKMNDPITTSIYKEAKQRIQDYYEANISNTRKGGINSESAVLAV